MTIKCTLTFNGRGIRTSSLIDTGANGFLFMDTRLGIDLCKYLDIRAQRLPYAFPVKGYDGRPGEPITHVLRLHLTIDGRRMTSAPFLLLPLGQHQIILGRKWMKLLGVKPNMEEHRLEWPRDLPPSAKILEAQDQIVSRTHIALRKPTVADRKRNKEHQAHADAREALWEHDEKRRRDGSFAIQAITQTPGILPITPPPIPPKPTAETETQAPLSQLSEKPSNASGTKLSKRTTRTSPTILSVSRTHQDDIRQSLLKMDKELKSLVTSEELQQQQKELDPKPIAPKQPALGSSLSVDIFAVSAAGFHYNMRRKDNLVFSTSLYEIDRLLEERASIAYADNEALQTTAINALDEDEDLVKVPSCYNEFLDVFSKAESDKLPPHRAYDHKIALSSDHDLKYSPLYKMSVPELETVKEYLLDNLSKGFIEPSQAPFAAPVLFVKKPNGGLRF